MRGLFAYKQFLLRLFIIGFILFCQGLIPIGVKANETDISSNNTISNKSINESLFQAAYNLDGTDRKLCLFIAIDSSPQADDGDSGDNSDDSEFPIAWLRGSHSLTASQSGLSISKLKDAITQLGKTPSGATLIMLLENAAIREKYQPITIHVAKTKNFIDSDLPIAFNSLITIKDKQKAFPFIIFNQDAMNGKYLTERKITVVLANELFDILGRLILGDDITATSDYQALGIILSDITLDKEIRKSNHKGNQKITKQEVVNLFNKALKDYSSFVPPLTETFISPEERLQLDALTSLASSGVFNNFGDLKKMSNYSHNYVAANELAGL